MRSNVIYIYNMNRVNIYEVIWWQKNIKVEIQS